MRSLFYIFCISSFINYSTGNHVDANTNIKMPEEIQLTSGESGFYINHIQCFSRGDEWIVFDKRNDDSKIGSTGSIGIVSVNDGTVKEIYRTEHQTEFGPGVGAAAFSPVSNRVIFIHGIRNANDKNPYAFTRRTGVAIDISEPYKPIFMDARDVDRPFTKGALRGGTHAHSWSGDGEWISFTYNDYILEQLSKENANVKDLRTIGVMVPGKVVVAHDSAFENNSGEMFSAIVAEVTENPKWGSNEIEKASDECWLGSNGYIKKNGTRQQRAIAFQGNLRDIDGNLKTEVFVADLPNDVSKAQHNLPLEGTTSTRPNVAAGVVNRRITYTKNGVQGPRHWLRAKSDGSLIAFLSKDDKGIIQIFGVSPNDDKIVQVTHNPFPVQGPFNFSPNNESIAYTADNSVFVTDVNSGKTKRVSDRFMDEEKPVGAVVWSNNGRMLAYNRFKKMGAGKFLHIFLLKDMD
jgi:hypothetical protein